MVLKQNKLPRGKWALSILKCFYSVKSNYSNFLSLSVFICVGGNRPQNSSQLWVGRSSSIHLPCIQSGSLCHSNPQGTSSSTEMKVKAFSLASDLISYHSPPGLHCHNHTWLSVGPPTGEASSVLWAFEHAVPMSGRLFLQRAAWLHPSSTPSSQKPSLTILSKRASPAPS